MLLPRAFKSPPEPPRALARMLESQRRRIRTEEPVVRHGPKDVVDAPERDRMRARPDAMPVGTQRWNATLLLHWPLPVSAVRPLVDPRLSIDQYEGMAWVSMTPCTLTRGRIQSIPALPAFHEIGLRTYVHLGTQAPGVWFLSLDASSLVAVLGGRAGLGLPYFWSTAARLEAGGARTYQCVRRRSKGRVRFQAVWEATGPERHVEPRTLDDFLLSRFRLYSAHVRGLVRQPLWHPPWCVQGAEECDVEETLSIENGLPKLGRPALAHFARQVDVEWFAPHRAH